MPRKGYKGITVKRKAQEDFLNAIRDARIKQPDVTNSEFLIQMLEEYERSKTY